MEKYDIVIVAHEKDFNNLKFIVEYADKNLESDEIHIIISERKEYLEYDILKEKTSRIVSIHKESDILKIDKSKIKYRPNWIYQMLLKFFQNVTKNDKPIDVIYSILQKKYLAYSIYPAIAKQLPNFSDINQIQVNYDWLIT